MTTRKLARVVPSSATLQRSLAARPTPAHRGVDSMQNVQRTVGNRAALRQLSQMRSASSPASATRSGAQHLERERDADAAAGRALCSDPQHRVGNAAAQAKRTAPANDAALLSPAIAALGPGKRLDPATRAALEPRLDAELGDVVVHVGSEARETTRAAGAQALAVGRHIAFGAGRFAPHSAAGLALLAHEVQHVLQHGSGLLAAGEQVARKEEPKIPNDEVSDILPSSGPLMHLMRIVDLYEVFGERLLIQHVRLIKGNPAAEKFVLEHGVPGIVALYEARGKQGLDPVAAARLLEKYPRGYSHEALDRLRLERKEAPPTFWFETPESQGLQPSEDGMPLTNAQERQKVFVEPFLEHAKVGRAFVFVRFAYSQTGVRVVDTEDSKDSKAAKHAKSLILTAILKVLTDLADLADAKGEGAREQLEVRARLDEVLRSFTKSAPLQVYIALDPVQEIKTQSIMAETARVYVRLEDVGQPEKLQAAVRVPLVLLTGIHLPMLDRNPASPEVLKDTLLHEALHVTLARRSSDAASIWLSGQGALTFTGFPRAAPAFVELTRRYLIAQEEVLVYDNVAALLPPDVGAKIVRFHNLRFVDAANEYFDSKKIERSTVTREVAVSERVQKRKVPWKFSYQIPTGAVDLSDADLRRIQEVLQRNPLLQ